MGLFEKNIERLKIVDAQKTIKTPLGELCFSIHADNIIIDTNTNYKHIIQTINDKVIYRWENNSFEAELMYYKPLIDIGDGMSVENSIAAVWRLRAKKTVNTSLEFKCFWAENYSWKDYGANSGEHFDAQTWEDGIYYVTIGTEDGEYLSIRSKSDKMVPKCLYRKEPDLGLIQYSDLGLLVPIPSIEENEICQIQFVVSWGKSELATWYAVGINTNEFFID